MLGFSDHKFPKQKVFCVKNDRVEGENMVLQLLVLEVL
jgi:hypothetical protein